MSETGVKIVIEGDATGGVAAAQQADASLDKLKNTAAGMAGAQTQIASEVGKKAVEELGHDAEKAEPWFEKLGVSHRALHQILHLIGHESGPAAGAAMAGLAAASGGGLLLAIMAAKELFEWLNKGAEAANKLRDAEAELWQAHSEAVANATVQNQEYLDSIAKIKAAHDQNKADDQAADALLKARAEQTQKILESEEKIALLKAHGDKAQEDSIRGIFEGKKSTAALAREAAEISATRQQLEQARMDQALAERAANQAQSDKQAAGLANEDQQKAIKQWLDEHKGDIAKAQAAVDKAGNVDDLSRQANAPVDPSLSDGGASLREIARIQLERAKTAQAQLDQAKADWDNYTRAAAIYKAQNEAYINAAEQSTEAFKRQTEEVNRLTAKLKQAGAIYDIDAQTAQVTQGITAPGTGAPPNPISQPQVPFAQTPRGLAQSDYSQLEAGYDLLRSGGALDAKQTQMLVIIATAMSGHTARTNKLLDAMQKIFSDHQAINAGFDRLQRQIESLAHNRQ